MTPRWPNIDDIHIVELLTSTEPVPDADMPRPTGGPHVVERVRLPLDTWRLVEAEAQARGIEPRELMAQLITAALSPELQQVITQLARRTPPDRSYEAVITPASSQRRPHSMIESFQLT